MPMKSGTGEDPFADDPDPTDQDEESASESSETEDSTPETADEPANSDTAETASSDDATGADDTETTLNHDDIPWVLRRSRVKDGRPEMIPVYVREETATRESEFMRAVEDAVGKDVYKFDAREAALLVAMNHPEEVAEQLNDWGYEFLD